MKHTHEESGMSLIEVLVAMSVLAILALSVAQSTVRSYRFFLQSTRSSLASQLALDKIEALAATNPALLNASTTTESDVMRDNVRFNRVTRVIVNSNGSRSVTVTVTATNAGSGGKAVLSSTFPEWSNT